MSSKLIVLYLVLALMIFGLWKSVTILDETQQMVVTRFGRITQAPVTTAGIQMLIPFLSDTYIYGKQLQSWCDHPVEMPTRDDKYISIEAFAHWKISDPVRFYQRVTTLASADEHLTDLLEGALRDEVARYSLAELVRSSGRRMDVTVINNILKVPEKKPAYSIKGRQPEIMAAMFKNVTTALDSMQLGIQVVDINLKSIKFIRTIE
ncbi:MAG: SPFH domain-containing protein [Candidatus Neomarinimicrobiota bacterium]